MCSPAIAMVAVAAAGSTYSAVQQNQTTQHAKGAAQAEQTLANAADAKATAIGPAQTSPVVSDQAAQAQAAAKKRQAALAAGMMSTIGTGGQGVTPTPSMQPQAFATGMKTALGQ